MKRKISKAITASIMSAAMLSTTVATFAPTSVFAGNMLGQSNFDEGVGLPWHTCETQPAKQTFNIDGGTYNVEIVNNDGPESRWDLQLRHRGLKIQSGHTYKVHWEVTASTAGEMYTKIGNYAGKVEVWHNNSGSGDFDQKWDCVQIAAGKNSFDAEFTADKTVEVAEWAFHYGGQGEHQPKDCFPNGTKLSFDNLTLECTKCGSDYSADSCNFDPSNDFGVITPHSNVRLNQVGYFEKLDKKATYVTNATSALPYKIVDGNGNTVHEGLTEPVGKDENSGENVHIIDFSELTKGGAGYQIIVDEKVDDYTDKAGNKYTMNESHKFNIANTVYDGILKNALNYYYQNRSGIPIEEDYVTSGDKSSLAHKEAGHATDEAWVQSAWVKNYAGDFSDGDQTYSIDGTGGWYDAGDHGKYVVNGGISVWTLQNMYEYSKSTGNDGKWKDGATMAIPEQTNGKPDILDEARYELEWMFKMIVDSKDPYYKDKAGMVYHKLHDHKWTGLAVRSWDYDKDHTENGVEVKSWGTVRIVKPPTTAATLNLSACAAQAARLWRGIDDKFADECLAKAKSTYEAAKKNPADFAPLDHAIGGGAYGDTYVDDDFYWAASELYATTGDQTYYTDLSKYANKDADDKAFSLTANLSGGENNGSFTSFNWGCTAGLGTLSLYLSDKTSAADKAKIETSIAATADKYIAQEAAEGMGIPYKGTTFQDAVNIGEGIDVTGYEWGSNSFVVNNAIVMAYAYNATGDNKYMNGVSEAMDYIFGRNGLGFSYVTGYGTYKLQNPHHRYWAYSVDNSYPMPPAGVMSGGPGSGMQDPYIGGLGYKRGTLAPQKCYVDSAEAWSVNEVTINWNAPFAWVISFLEDEAPLVTDDPNATKPTKPTSAPTDKPTDATDEPTDGPTSSGKEATVDTSKKATKWGDVDCNGIVESPDIVRLNRFLLDPEANDPSGKTGVTEQGLVNANCEYDNFINMTDSGKIVNYVAEIIKYEKLGPQ